MILSSLRTSRRPSLKSRALDYHESLRAQTVAKRIALAIEHAAPRHGPGFVCVYPAGCVTCASHRQAMESAAIARQVGGVTS